MTYDVRRALHQARLARWNAAQERAKNAYDREPLTVCGKCHGGLHRRCTGWLREDGDRIPCGCDDPRDGRT